MPHFGGLGPVDLAVIALVGAAVLAGLTHRAGLLGAAARGVATGVACWLGAAALLLWAPAALATAVAGSGFAHLVPPPVQWLAQASHLVAGSLGHSHSLSP